MDEERELNWIERQACEAIHSDKGKEVRGGVADLIGLRSDATAHDVFVRLLEVVADAQALQIYKIWEKEGMLPGKKQESTKP